MRPLAIFDIDGTLIDSQDHIVAAMGFAFDHAELPLPDRTTLLSIVGLSLAEAFRALAPGQPSATIERLSHGYRTAFTDRMQETGLATDAPLFPGARALLDSLVDGGPVLGIATGKVRRGVDRMCAAHGLEHMFATVQTADRHPSKPHPSMVLEAVRETAADPGRTVMIGDTVFDIEMGQAAGVRTIAVTWGNHAPDRLRALRPDRVVDDFTQLGAAIDELVA